MAELVGKGDEIGGEVGPGPHRFEIDRRPRLIIDQVPPAEGIFPGEVVTQRDEHVVEDPRAEEVEVQLASAHELCAQHERAPVGGCQPIPRGAREPAAQLSKIRDPGHVQLDEVEAHNVATNRLDVYYAPATNLNHDGTFQPSFARLGAASLEVAGIDDPRLIRVPATRKDHPRMHVPERPVVEADVAQVLECARAVVVVSGGRASHVAVKNAHLETGPGCTGKAQREILRFAALGEAHALHRGHGDSVDLDGHRLDCSGSEDGDAFGPGTPESRPARLDRVVIAVDDEAGDARRRQAGEAVTQAQLSPKSSLGPVIDVARDDEKGGAPLQAQIDEGVERDQRGFSEPLGHERRRRGDAFERRIEVQVRCMDETEVCNPRGLLHWCEATRAVYRHPGIPANRAKDMSEMPERTGGDVVVDELARAGVDTVFGIPSVHNLPIYDAIRRDRRIRAVTVRHEQGAVGAADGFARTTGRLGVCITSTGPGAANAMAGQLEACVSSSPVLHLTGQIDSRFLDQRRGFIHEAPDQLGMLASSSKASHRPVSADGVAATISRAAAEAMECPRGPVAVEIPIDFQYAPATLATGPVGLASVPPAPTGLPDEADLARAAELIARSRRPIVWAGGGVVAAGACGEVAVLVRRLGAGLLTSPNGRGVIPEDDSSCIGNLPWDPDVRALCCEADLLVAIGTRFQGPNTDNWTMELPARLVQLDIDRSVPGRNYPVEAAVVGDAKVSTAALLRELDRMGAPPRLAESGWAERVVAAAGSGRRRLRGTLGAQVGLLDALASCLDARTVVVKDSTIPAYTWGNRLLPVLGPRTSIMANSFAIGLGLPHAVGAGVASQGRPVVLLVGDGGFLLAASELATVAQEGIPIVVLVFVDGGYGILRNIQDRQYGPETGRIGVDIGRPDFCGLAAAFGVQAERVSSIGAYAAALRRALVECRPWLVEVDLDAIGPMTVAYTGTSKPPTPR